MMDNSRHLSGLEVIGGSKLAAFRRHCEARTLQTSCGEPILGSDCLPRLRRQVERIAGRLGYVDDVVKDIGLCLTEAVTNVLLHADGGMVHYRVLPEGLQI